MNHPKCLLLALGLLTSTACINSAVPLNPNAPPIENGISGTVIVEGVEEPGNVIITVYDAARPGPPEGTGRPLTFSAVSFLEFTGDAGGIQSADFYVGNLPDGEYLVSALLDQDGDFNPFASGLAGSTCGDYVGTHVTDLASRAPATVSVSGGELVDDITIVIDIPIQFERPASIVNADFTPMSEATGTNPLTPQRYLLDATSVHTMYPPQDNRDDYPDGYPLTLSGPCPPDPVNPALCDLATTSPCDVAFWVIGYDEDGDGFVDDHPNFDPELGLKNIWPRVFLTYLGEPDESSPTGFTPDYPLEEGQFIAGENFPYLVETTFGGFPFPLNTFVPVRQLSVAWAPAVRVFNADGSEAAFLDLRSEEVSPEDFPSGAWSITVMQRTGQTWTLPNELVALPNTMPESGYDPLLQAGVMVTED